MSKYTCRGTLTIQTLCFFVFFTNIPFLLESNFIDIVVVFGSNLTTNPVVFGISCDSRELSCVRVQNLDVLEPNSTKGPDCLVPVCPKFEML